MMKNSFSNKNGNPCENATFFKWKSRVSEEVSFWDNWFKTGGLQWPEGFSFRLDPNTELQGHVVDALNTPSGSNVRILDVGAGPLTFLGKRWKNRNLIITAVDPLSQEYDRLLKRYKIKPPVRTVHAHAEKLLSIFKEDCFDLVHARNSIDHCYAPLEAIQQMLGVVKPDCYVLLHHKINEGENAQYQGLHQWNFYASDDDFYISNTCEKFNVTREFFSIAEVRCKIKNNWILASIRKKS